MNFDGIDRQRRALEKLRQLSALTGSTYKETPAEVIEILVEGMDDLTAAKHLLQYGDFLPALFRLELASRAEACWRIR